MQMIRPTLMALAIASTLVACGGDGDSASALPEEKRAQDDRTFAPSDADAKATTFAALKSDPGDVVDMASTDRYAGVLNGAAYRIEVPAKWNGKLVMYAHGYAGTGAVLGITNPAIRRHLIQMGYAWAASSYSTNYYDVRAGVEDTNALAIAFRSIAQARGRDPGSPQKTYIIGHSMGGHISAAAVEKETLDTAKNKVRYDGAVPMCGVVGDTELFDYFAGAQLAAQALTGYAGTAFTSWSTIQAPVMSQLLNIDASGNIAPIAPKGLAYASVVQNLTGGPRPLFGVGLAQGKSFGAVLGVFGGDGTINGILNKKVLDTRSITYTVDGDAATSALINSTAQKLTPDADANRLRRDGLRWIPQVNGEFSVPVVTLHTLGDLYVPFSMEQIYRTRAKAKGSDNWLVQRAIRGITHCDFTVAEQEAAFDAMTQWEQTGSKPVGDDVLTAATVAQPQYGCNFSNNTPRPDDSATTLGVRQLLVNNGLGCPAR